MFIDKTNTDHQDQGIKENINCVIGSNNIEKDVMRYFIDRNYLELLKFGPQPISHPKMDLKLGITISKEKEKDFFKYLCNEN